jgi:hypothetical protein
MARDVESRLQYSTLPIGQINRQESQGSVMPWRDPKAGNVSLQSLLQLGNWDVAMQATMAIVTLRSP